MPIVTDLNIRLKTHMDPPWPNFRVADWKAFREALVPNLAELAMTEYISMEAEFFTHTHALTCAITEVIDACIPKCRPMPHQKHWWSWELADR